MTYPQQPFPQFTQPQHVAPPATRPRASRWPWVAAPVALLVGLGGGYVAGALGTGADAGEVKACMAAVTADGVKTEQQKKPEDVLAATPACKSMSRQQKVAVAGAMASVAEAFTKAFSEAFDTSAADTSSSDDLGLDELQSQLDDLDAELDAAS